jgi:hypothetical protein
LAALILLSAKPSTSRGSEGITWLPWFIGIRAYLYARKRVTIDAAQYQRDLQCPEIASAMMDAAGISGSV